MEISNERIVSIYTLSCPDTLEVRYVGKTVNIICRKSQHCSMKNLTRSASKVNSWLIKLLRENKKPVMKIIDSCKESDNWQSKEVYWISHYRKTGKIYNLTDGGEGVSGVRFSEERKEKIRQVHLGKKKNYVTYFSGRKRGPMPDSVKIKVSRGKKGEVSKRRIKVGLYVGGYLVNSFNSITEAAFKTNVTRSSISNNILGYSQKTKLGIWKRI